jgi:hypothetical protein
MGCACQLQTTIDDGWACAQLFFFSPALLMENRIRKGIVYGRKDAHTCPSEKSQGMT